jgi:hypothetical protein
MDTEENRDSVEIGVSAKNKESTLNVSRVRDEESERIVMYLYKKEFLSQCKDNTLLEAKVNTLLLQHEKSAVNRDTYIQAAQNLQADIHAI